MPYKIKGKCIYKKNTGKKVGCTKGSVKKYMKALHSNVKENIIFKLFSNIILESNSDKIILGVYDRFHQVKLKWGRKGDLHDQKFPEDTWCSTCIMFRYLPETKRVYWWEEPDDEVKFKVHDKLEKNDLKVIGDSLHGTYNSANFKLTHESIEVTKKDRGMVDKKTLSKGAKVEKEHTSNQKKAEKIAIQHIKEFPIKKKLKKGVLDSKYYDKLDDMETKLKREGK